MANENEEIPTEQVSEVEPEVQTEGEPKSEIKAEGEPKSEKVMPEWVERRFGQLSAEKHGLRKSNAELATENQSLKEKIQTLFGGKPIEEGKPVEEAPKTAAPDIDAMANKMADDKLAIRAFNEACNRVADDGAKAHDDFKDVAAVLATGYGDMLRDKPEFLQTITELPNGHEVYYNLGKHPQEAERILALPPIKMALELGKLSNEISKPIPREVSGAPTPIKPLNGLAGKKDLTLEEADDAPIDQWMQIREKDLAAKYR